MLTAAASSEWPQILNIFPLACLLFFDPTHGYDPKILSRDRDGGLVSFESLGPQSPNTARILLIGWSGVGWLN